MPSICVRGARVCLCVWCVECEAFPIMSARSVRALGLSCLCERDCVYRLGGGVACEDRSIVSTCSVRAPGLPCLCTRDCTVCVSCVSVCLVCSVRVHYKQEREVRSDGCSLVAPGQKLIFGSGGSWPLPPTRLSSLAFDSPFEDGHTLDMDQTLHSLPSSLWLSLFV